MCTMGWKCLMKPGGIIGAYATEGYSLNSSMRDEASDPPPTMSHYRGHILLCFYSYCEFEITIAIVYNIE